MQLSEIIQLQIRADKRRGFLTEFGSDNDRQNQLMREVVGLLGEVGEFANMLKKVDLALNIEGYIGPTLSDASANLREELVDAIIYIIRLSTMLEGDLEQDILAKMKVNDERYSGLER